jgi:rhamnogalacturonyl hydrolase YesR
MTGTSLLQSISRLDHWLTLNDWKDYDPFDGLSMPNADLLTRNNHYLRIALQQTVRRFPINLRPLLGIKKVRGSKGMGFCALGYLRLYQATGENHYLDRTKFCLDWLTRNYSKGFSGYCWGNHFSYESRGGTIPKGIPTIVWTSLIADVFIEAYEVLNRPEYLDVAKSCGRFIMNDIGRFEASPRSLCMMYTPPMNGKMPSWNGTIHNSNVLGARVLARLYRHGGGQELLKTAKKAIQFTVDHQRPQGGWYYGEPRKYRWIDNFHTGYVLESIYGYIQATQDNDYEESLRKGYRYFVTRFFEPDGTPRYYDTKTYPIDIQCASQGIQTLVNLKDYDPVSLPLAGKVAEWTVANMQDPKGFFYFRKYPLITNKTPTFHWGQATMLSALAHLHKAQSESIAI